jgi:spore germination cell wall hydrolase CwlJ-like protein
MKSLAKIVVTAMALVVLIAVLCAPITKRSSSQYAGNQYRQRMGEERMKNLIEQSMYLAICIYHEAQGEPFDGKVAVGHVIMNRLRKENKSVKDVILRPYQFSWANKGERPPIKYYSSFIECVNAAMRCYEERLEGKDLHGVDHYFADYIDKPKWAESMTLIAVIGKHQFYKE